MEISGQNFVYILHYGDQIVVLKISKAGKDNAAMGLYFYTALRDFNFLDLMNIDVHVPMYS